jgi:hypothetical protein
MLVVIVPHYLLLQRVMEKQHKLLLQPLRHLLRLQHKLLKPLLRHLLRLQQKFLQLVRHR